MNENLKNKVVVGIDPGKSGAIAIKFNNGVITYDCPETQKEVCDLVAELPKESFCYLEKVHSMPKQGVKSVWSFSANYATWQTALICNGIPFIEVSPQSWMKAMGNLPADKKLRKNAIKDAMQKMYPSLKVTINNADALAIMTHAVRAS